MTAFTTRITPHHVRTWTWGSIESPLTGLAACLIEVPDGPRMELIFTLPRMIGQLGIVRRQGVMCLTTEPFRPTPEGVLQGDIVFWQVDGAEITRVLGEWCRQWRPRLSLAC